jgi:hypothetical protein
LDEDTRHSAPTGLVMNISRPTAPVPAEPSWARVLANTITIWVSRRRQSGGFGQRRMSGGRPGRDRSGWRTGWLAASRWRLAVLLLALAAIAAATLPFTGVFAGSAAPVARASFAAKPAAGKAGSPDGLSPAAVIRAEAAAWLASQVNAGAIIACDPAMCAALQARGVIAGRLMPLQAGAADPHGATVVVTSALAGRQLASQYAPAVIASFGSGSSQVEVRATEPGGAAAYESALRADLAARQSAGSQLLRNSSISFTAQDAAQLRAGEVDSRLLATLAALSSQYAFRVAAFGDTSPGAPVLFREVTITDRSRDGAALPTIMALVNQQHPPYLPAHAAIIHTPAGQAAVLIEFAAPSPLGLLTAVLVAYSQPAA